MKFLLSLAVALLSVAALAAEDATDKSYAIEKEVQNFRIQADGSYVVRVEQIIRINEERAINVAAQRSLAYTAPTESLEILQAYTLKPDGRQVPVPADRIKDVQQAASAAAPTYMDGRNRVLIYPQVAVGDRLVLHYQRSRSLGKIGQHFTDLTGAGATIAQEQLSLSYDLPANLALQIDNRGFSAVAPVSAAGRTVYRWDFKAGPIPRLERGSISSFEFRPRLLVSTLPDYAEMARIVRAAAEGKSAVTPAIRAKAEQLSKGITAPREQAAAIANWVRRYVRMINLTMSKDNLVPHTAQQVLDAGFGDSKDKTVLLQAMLSAIGIEAQAVLINSGAIYSVPKAASLDVLNDVIAYLPAMDWYIDVGASTDANYLPNVELDKPVLNLATGTLARTPRQQTNEQHAKGVFVIDANGAASFTNTIELVGGKAEGTRIGNRRASAADFGVFVENILRARGQTGSGSYDPGNVDALGDRYQVAAKGQIDNFIDLPGPIGLAAPGSFLNPMSGIVQGLLTETTRTQPYLCPMEQFTDRAEFQLAKEIDLIALPKPSDVKNDFFDYSATYTRQGNAIIVERRFDAHPAARVCTPEDFQRMQPAIELMARDLKKQLILRTL